MKWRKSGYNGTRKNVVSDFNALIDGLPNKLESFALVVSNGVISPFQL